MLLIRSAYKKIEELEFPKAMLTDGEILLLIATNTMRYFNLEMLSQLFQYE